MKKLQGLIAGVLIGIMLTCVALAANWNVELANFPILLNGIEWKTDKPIVTIDGSTYLPLRALGDALGVKVEWNNEMQRVEIGDTPTTATSTTIEKKISKFINVVTDDRTYMIADDNSLWICGYNYPGQTYEEREIKKPIKIMENVSMASLGEGAFNMIVKTDNTLWGFGNNFYGTMGINNTETEYALPIKIMDDVKFVSAGDAHVLAIKTDNTLWGWGMNTRRQLGVATYAQNEPNPTKVMDNVVFVSAGGETSFAIKEDGTLWAWGNNDCGQIGNDTIGDKDAGDFQKLPIKIMDNIISVSTNGANTMAIDKYGVLWGWGLTNHSQVIDEREVTRLNKRGLEVCPKPTKIMDNITSVYAGHLHTMGIKKDNSLWAWGLNAHGQFLNSEIDKYYHPTEIMQGVKSVSSESATTVIKLDSTLWVWGSNQNGRLGTGVSVGSFVPTQIIVEND